MREILFRGKRIDNGEWVEGALYCYYDFERTIVQILTDRTNGIPDAFEVYPDTVGQYTGLTDKDGKKIFEGDICKMEICKGHPDPSPFLISIKNACVGFEPMLPDRCHPDDRKWRPFWNSEAEYMWDPDYFTVIGNIHDNPELMEEDDA